MSKLWQFVKNYWGKVVLIVGLGVSCWGFSSLNFPKIDAFIRDALQYFNSTKKVHADLIATLNINIKKDNLSYPHTADNLSKIIDKLQEANPKYIFIAMEPIDFSKDRTEKEKIFNLISKHQNIYLNGTAASNQISTFKADGIFKDYPRFLNYIVAVDQITGSKDGKSRRAVLTFEKSNDLDFERELAELGLNPKKPHHFAHSWDYWGTKQALIKSFPPNVFGNYDSHELLNNELPLEYFKNKIVVVGAHDEFSFLSLPTIFNLTNTPTHNILTDTEPYHHTIANLINFHISGDYIKKIPFNDLVFTFIILSLIIVLPFGIATKIAALILTAPLLLFIELIIYLLGDYYVDLSKSIALILSIQYLAIPIIALIVFKRQNQQKHKELTEAKFDILISLSEKLAHDIRSPLSSIRLMLAKVSFLDKEHKEITFNSLKKIEDISDNFLKRYGTHYADNIPLENFDIVSLVERILEEKLSVFPNINFSFNKGNFTYFYVFSNQHELQRVLLNLLDNSIYALKTVDKKNIHVTLESEKSYCILTLTDNGAGIPSDLLSIIGDQRVTTKPDSIGNGIGLLHAKRTLQAMNSSLEIKSTRHTGTTICLKLPIS